MSENRLTEQQLNQLKPIIIKFSELIDNIDKGDPKRIPRNIKDFEKSKFPKFSPPYVQTVRAYAALKAGELERSVVLAREAIEWKNVAEKNICAPLIHIFKYNNDVEHLDAIYQRIIDQMPNETEPVLWDIPYQLSQSNFVKAQERAMKYVSMTKNAKEKEAALIFAAICSYLRAKVDKPLFYKFAVSFIEKVGYENADLAEIKINSLLEEDPNNQPNHENALKYVQSDKITEIFSFNPLRHARLEMKVLKSIGLTEMVGQVASKVLKTINSNSIDEWKLAIQYYPDIDNLITELSDGLCRGPQLAKIDLAIHRNEDPVPHIIQYEKIHSNKPFLIGDIKPYLTDDILAKLSSKVSDFALRTMIDNKYRDENVSIDANKVVVATAKAQDLIRRGDFASLCEAANVLSISENICSTSRIFLIRISGLLGLSVAQNKFWTEQRLEAIQYLSLTSLYFNDAYNSWDLNTLKNMAKNAISFARKGLAQFANHINEALMKFNFGVIEMTARFKKQIANNLSLYAMRVMSDWLNILYDIKQITPYKFEGYISSEKVDELEEKIDDSVVPLYIKDEKLQTAIFPSIRQRAKLLSAATRVLFALKLNPENESYNDYLLDLDSIASGTQWTVFSDFVKSGCKKIEANSGLSDYFVIGSIAIAAKIKDTTARVAEQLKKVVGEGMTNLINSLRLDQIPEILSRHNKEQIKSITDAHDQILNLLIF